MTDGRGGVSWKFVLVHTPCWKTAEGGVEGWEGGGVGLEVWGGVGEVEGLRGGEVGLGV